MASRDMIEISPSQVTQQVRSLFSPGDPASIRCFAALEGRAEGRVWVDDPAHPSWAVLQAAFGSLYFGGTPEAGELRETVARFRKEGPVLVGLWPEDERFGLLAPDPDYLGSVLEFAGRAGAQALDGYLRAPAGCEVRTVDRALFLRSQSCSLLVSIFGSVDRAMQEGFGACLMEGDEILSEAFAGPASLGMIEIGTETADARRGLGYSTIACAHVIQECERLGFRTYWNCDTDNPASVAVARKLGFQAGREYTLWAWFRR